MAAHCDGGACEWSGEEVLEEFTYYSGRSGADGVRRDYSSWL
jgi:hypothetical protein